MVLIDAGALRTSDGGAVVSSVSGAPLKIGKLAASTTEVTNAQIHCFRHDQRSQGKLDPEQGRLPVVDISWQEIVEFTQWLKTQTGRRYRLPTQAEWEYLARAGTFTPYPWGNAANHDYANYGQEECCGPRRAGRDQFDTQAPVGQFPPNAFGLFDMNGNVWELTQDGPTEPPGAKYICGGAWSNPPHMIRSDNCGYATIDHKSRHMGFRLVADQE